MRRCPILRKIADCSAKGYLTPKDLAELLGCQPRQAQNIFRRHLMSLSEASAPGKHMRLTFPLSSATLQKLRRLRNPKPFTGKIGEIVGNFDEELTEWRLIDLVYGLDVFGEEEAPVPTLQQLADPLYRPQQSKNGKPRRILKALVGGKGRVKIVRQIQRQLVIIARTKGVIRRRQLMRQLFLRGIIYELWCEAQQRKLPTATQAMKAMKVSRDTFYKYFPDRPRSTFKRIRGEVLAGFLGELPKQEVTGPIDGDEDPD